MTSLKKQKASIKTMLERDESCCLINIPGNIRFNAYAGKYLRLKKYRAAKIFLDEETNTLYMLLCKERDYQSYTLGLSTNLYILYTQGLFDTIPFYSDYEDYLMTFRLVKEYHPELKENVLRMELTGKEDRRSLFEYQGVNNKPLRTRKLIEGTGDLEQ